MSKHDETRRRFVRDSSLVVGAALVEPFSSSLPWSLDQPVHPCTGVRAVRGDVKSPRKDIRAHPSQLHEVLLQLFRNRPALAPELLRDALHQELPSYTEARIDSADLSEVQPAEYRADLVVLLLDGVPVFGVVVEVQLSPDDRKQYVWPAYVAGLRARLKCPVSLLVITADDACARWAARPINLGGAAGLSRAYLALLAYRRLQMKQLHGPIRNWQYCRPWLTARMPTHLSR